MKVRKLTKRVVEGVKQTAKAYEITDGNPGGFILRVLPSGRKSYLFRGRLPNGQKRTVTIGEPSPALTPDIARRRAQELRLRMREGEDPSETKSRDRRMPTVDQWCDDYIELRVPQLKASTQVSEKQLIRCHVRKRFGSKRLDTLRTSDIERLRGVLKRGAFNKVHGIISRMWNWAAREDRYPIEAHANPTRGVRKNKERSMERFLRPEERAAVAEVLADAEGRTPRTKGYVRPMTCNVLRALSLTGCRLGELTGLRWRQVDLTHHRLWLKDSKTGDWPAPITRQAAWFFAELPQGEPDDLVFPGERGTRITNIQRVWGRLRVLAGLEDVRIHDLRHSWASDAVSAGVGMIVIQKVLGHSNIRTTERYAHLADEALQQGLDLAGRAIQERTQAGAEIRRRRRLAEQSEIPVHH